MRAAALCAGYGGLELGLELAGVDIDLIWYSEIDKHASLVMAHHHPDAPNLGDLTTIDNPPQVDIVTAGFPCQPVSTAGARKGVNDDRWLIHDVVGLARRAGARWLLLENVSGLYSANEGEALGQVADALTEGGFDAEWAPLRASDVGACHQRLRWFCLATPDADHEGDEGLGCTEPHGRSIARCDARELGLTLLPTPTANQPGGTAEQHLARKRGGKMNRTDPCITDLRMALEVLLLPTPRTGPNRTSRRAMVQKDSMSGPSLEQAAEWSQGITPRELTELEAVQLLPTPTVADQRSSGSAGYAKTDTHTPGVTLTDATQRGLVDWSVYGPAIARHEQHVTRRPAPSPLTDAGKLCPIFVEWMMGLPEGHVTDVPGLSRAQQLGRLGNGVVPQQAAAAITALAARFADRPIAPPEISTPQETSP